MISPCLSLPSSPPSLPHPQTLYPRHHQSNYVINHPIWDTFETEDITNKFSGTAGIITWTVLRHLGFLVSLVMWNYLELYNMPWALTELSSQRGPRLDLRDCENKSRILTGSFKEIYFSSILRRTFQPTGLHRKWTGNLGQQRASLSLQLFC